MKRQLFWAGVLIIAAVQGANLYILTVPTSDLFKEAWWLDIPLHIFGGMGVAFFTLWFMVWTGIAPLDESRTWLAGRMRLAFPGGAPWWWWLGGVLGGIGLAALGWEVLEACAFYYPRQPFPPGYPIDTIKDICNGVLGATIAWAAFFRVQLRAWQKVKASREQSTQPR